MTTPPAIPEPYATWLAQVPAGKQRAARAVALAKILARRASDMRARLPRPVNPHNLPAEDLP